MGPRTIPLSMIGGPVPAKAANASPVPATVWAGGEAISETEIAREMQHHPSADPYRARAAAARALVVRRLLRLEAEAAGLVAGVRPQAGETQEEACIRVLMQAQLESAPQPDDAACRRFHEHNRDLLRRPDRARVRHILLAAAPEDAGARDDARRLAAALLEELRDNPAAFAGQAKRHSACPSREQGGDLGWITKGSTTAEFERQVFRLPAGVACSLVESRYGCHVVAVDELHRGEELNYEDARPLIRTHLEKVAAHNALQRYLAMLFERHGVHGLEDPGAPA